MARSALVGAALAATLVGTTALPAVALPAGAAGDDVVATVTGEVHHLVAELEAGGHVALTVVVPDDGDPVRVEPEALADVASGAVVEVDVATVPAPAPVTEDVAPAPVVDVDVLEEASAVTTARRADGLAAAIAPGTRTVHAVTALVAGQAADAVTADTLVADVRDEARPYWAASTDGAVLFEARSGGAVGRYDEAFTRCTEADVVAFLGWVGARGGAVTPVGGREHTLVRTPRVPACGFAGIAHVADGGVAWVNGNDTVASRRHTVTHELGHTLTLGHSDSRIFCGPGYDRADGTSAQCAVDGLYADVYDVMGSGAGGYGLLSGAHLDRLGLLGADRAVHATDATTVTLAAVSGGSGVRFLRFDSGDTRYYVEYRGAVGRDANLGDSRLGCPDGLVGCSEGPAHYMPGVVVRRLDADVVNASTYLLDAGRGDAAWNPTDAWFTLPLGRTFGTADGRWSVQVLAESADGTSATVRLSRGTVGYAQIVATPDLTGEGHADLLAVDASGLLHVVPGNGNGTLGPPTPRGRGWTGLAIYAPGDLSGDGRNDIVVTDAGGRLYLYRGNGWGGFSSAQRIGQGWTGYRIIPIGDLDGDRRVDLLGIDPGGRLWFYPGRGGGLFGKAIRVGQGWTGYELHPGGDGNGDGRTDILGIDPAGRLWFYAGRGGGTFSKAVRVGQGWTGYRFASGADFNGDGRGDLMGRDSAGRLWFYAGRPGGTFSKAVQVGTGW